MLLNGRVMGDIIAGFKLYKYILYPYNQPCQFYEVFSNTHLLGMN